MKIKQGMGINRRWGQAWHAGGGGRGNTICLSALCFFYYLPPLHSSSPLQAWLQSLKYQQNMGVARAWHLA